MALLQLTPEETQNWARHEKIGGGFEITYRRDVLLLSPGLFH